MSKLVFSPSDDEILVQEVQNNRVLYDMAAADYKNIIIKDNIWKDIATKIGKSTDYTKKRWKNIRDSYSRNKRKPGTGSAASSKKKWSLATHLTFLDQVECEREYSLESTSNVTMRDNMDVSLDEERDDTSPSEATNDLPTESSTRKVDFLSQKVLLICNFGAKKSVKSSTNVFRSPCIKFSPVASPSKCGKPNRHQNHNVANRRRSSDEKDTRTVYLNEEDEEDEKEENDEEKLNVNDILEWFPRSVSSDSIVESTYCVDLVRRLPSPLSIKVKGRFCPGTSISSLRNNGSSSETQTKQRQHHHPKARESQVHNINIHLHGLFAAVEHGQLEKARNILTTCEVQVNSVNSDGLTPLDVAFLSNNRDLVRLLLTHGATEETSMKNLETHLSNLLEEAEDRVIGLRRRGNQDDSQTKSLALWERRKRGLKKMRIGFEHAKPPDKPEKIILEVTGNDNVRVSCIEAEYPESAICTKFNVEWSTSESFKNLTGSKCIPATNGEITINNLEHGKTYYFRCRAGNLKDFSDYQYPTPFSVTISSWWDVCQEPRRCSAAMKVKMDDILDKMISIRPDLHRSLFEVSGNDCTSNTKRRKPPTFKQLFSGNTKLHKNLRRGVYLSCLLYHEDKVLVTNEDYLPVVEIDDTYPKEMLNDFHWFYKIAFAWKDLKWFKDDLEKSTNSSISFRTKLIQAVTQMQDIFNTQDLGKVYYKPIRDSDGTTVICTVNNVCQPKNVVNLKWTPMAKILKKSSRSDNLTDLLISSIQDQIMFYQTSNCKLQKGLYVGYLLMRSSVDMLHVMVPLQNPNMPVCCKIRDNPHVTAEEWLWLQQGAGAPCDYTCLGFASQFKMATNRLFSMVQIPKDKRTVQRVYTSEVIEVDPDVSLIMIVPPAEVACAVGEGNQSAVHLHRIELVPLSVQVFEMIHFGTYRADTLLLYARLSSVVQLDSDDARYSIRQAWSSSDLETAKQRLDTVESLETGLNAAWKHLRWLLDVMNFARERLFQAQVSNSNCSKSASNSQLEMKSAKSNSLLQLPDSKLVKSRGSWPGPGLNSMRTLESVCPEISRSEQYLSPPVHDREYGLAKKQSCSSETSNDSKDEPEFNDGQSSDLADLSSKTNHLTAKDVNKVDDKGFSDATMKSESLVPVPAPGIIEVCAAYDTGLPHPTSLKLHISPTTSAREVVQLFLQQLNMSVVVKGKTGPIYPSTEFGNFCLVSVTGARERCLRDDFKPLQLTHPWRDGRMYIRHKQDVLAALELHSSILTVTATKHH